MSDSHIIGFIVGLFVIMGIAMPFVNVAMGEPASSFNIEAFQDDLSGVDDGTINAIDLVRSIRQMFYWHPSLGNGLNAIFLIFRFMFLYLLVKTIIRGAGG